MASWSMTPMWLQRSPRAAAAGSFMVKFTAVYGTHESVIERAPCDVHVRCYRDLSCYIILVPKTGGKSERRWCKRACPCHLGWFALSLQRVHQQPSICWANEW